MFTPRTTAKSLAWGIFCPGSASPSAMARLISAAPVNLCETESVDNHCAVVASSFGSLIQATAGSSGGVGTFRTNRSGWAA